MLFVSAAAWILLVVKPGMAMFSPGLTRMLMAMPSSASSHLSPALISCGSAAVDWALMLAAMMLPLLIAPVRHVRERSFARRRPRAIALFLAGYVAVWLVAGIFLLSALALLNQIAAPGSSRPVMLVAVIAIVWQFSPAKQRCLNRCHAHPELAAFGSAADIAALRFGAVHGVWCVGSCWALMPLPMLISRMPIAAMGVLTLLLFAERLDSPMPPRWRWHGVGKAARIAVAQLGMRRHDGWTA